ncbi:alcohol dehydrogenase class-3-like protein [Aphelenchoides avenae]|nr:alcohol dehydrogenase class-3-like protein [Aphelenchus avenae]
MGCSTFSEYTVCPVIEVAKISKRARLDRACLLACGVSTGYGVALKVAKVQPNSRCAVWGVGAVGLSVVVGCKRAGASQIVAIDLNPKKLELAKRFGATHTINPNEISKFGSMRKYITKNFDGGFDFTFECIGNVHTTREALECCTAGGGTACVVGIPPKGEKFNADPMFFINGRTLIGTLLGGWKCRDDIPRLVEEAEAGMLDLDAFITHRMPLDDINKALELHHAGNW